MRERTEKEDQEGEKTKYTGVEQLRASGQLPSRQLNFQSLLYTMVTCWLLLASY
jgi:hypothetical protein